MHRSRRWSRGGWVTLLTLAILAPAIPPATAAAHTPLTFGPPDPAIGGLPGWIASPGAEPCSLTLIDDHGPYYELAAIGEQNGMRFRYIAGVEGFPFGDPEINPDPFVLNGLLIRVEELPAGTYTVEEPHGLVTSIAHGGGRLVFEPPAPADPRDGPILDLTVQSGLFRLLRGSEVVISAETDHTCAPFVGDPANAPPIPSFTIACAGNTCDFDASASRDTDGTIVAYGWDFGDGLNGAGVTTSHTYARGGTFVIRLLVTDDGGVARSTTQTIVLNIAPSAAFASLCQQRVCGFDAGSSGDPDGSIVSYAWNFGDGNTGTGPAVQHSYAADGDYSVVLTVTDDDGATGMAVRTIPVRGPTFTATFQPHNGNNWWVQTKVSGNDAVTAVCASVNGGTCTPLTLRSWGSWAASFFVPTGAAVTFTATSASGSFTSGPYHWPSGTPAGGGSPPPPPGGMTATFQPHSGNNWWVQTKVTSSHAVTGVCASVDGGVCRALTLRSWGSWAASFFVPTGATVTFTATSAAGSATSGGFVWPSGTPTGGGSPPPSGFSATFSPHNGNNWWVQTKVSGNQPVTAVCASVNGGACQTLTLRSWGSWAASFFVPTGAQVRFTATAAGGATATSGAFTWPVA